MPEKPRELRRLWLIEAAKYNVLPPDDRYNERINPELAGRPDYITGNEQTLFPGMKRLTETSVLNIKNKSFQITAQLIVPHGGANGTIFAQGGRFGGWGLMMHEGAARFVYNLVGVEVSVIDAEEPLPAGEHQVRAEFAYDGGGAGQGRNRHSLLRRRADRPGHARGHRTHRVQPKRDSGDWPRARHHRTARHRPRRHRLQRQDQLGSAHHRPAR